MEVPSVASTPRAGFSPTQALILHLSMVLGTVRTDKNSRAMTLYPQSGENINNRAKCEDGSKFQSKPNVRLLLLSRQPHWTIRSAHCVIISWVIFLILRHLPNSSSRHTSATSDCQDFHAQYHKNTEVRNRYLNVSVGPPAHMDRRASLV